MKKTNNSNSSYSYLKSEVIIIKDEESNYKIYLEIDYDSKKISIKSDGYCSKIGEFVFKRSNPEKAQVIGRLISRAGLLAKKRLELAEEMKENNNEDEYLKYGSRVRRFGL